MPAPTLNFLDSFVRADSAAGSPGNAWLDIAGASFKTKACALGNFDNLDFSDGRAKRCLRPTGDGLTADSLVLVNIASPVSDARIYLRNNASTGVGYAFAMAGSTGYIYFIRYVDFSTAGVNIGVLNIAPNFNGAEYIVRFSVRNISGGTARLLGEVFNGNVAGFPLIGSTTFDDSSGFAAITSGGVAGYNGGGNIATACTRFAAYSAWDGTSPPAPVTSILATTGHVWWKPSLDASKNHNGVSLRVYQPLKGSGAKSMQLLRAPAPGGTYALVGSPVTGFSGGGYRSGSTVDLTDTSAVPGTQYAYGVRSSDALGATADVTGVSIKLPSSLDGGGGFVADSLGGGSDWKPSPRPGGGFNPNQAETLIWALRGTNAAGSGRGIAFVNFGQGGYTIANGLNDLNSSAVGYNITDMVAYFNASGLPASKKKVMIQYGVNDGGVAPHENQADFLGYLDSMCTLLIANGIYPVLNYGPFDDIGNPDPTLETNYRRRQDFNAAVETVLGRSYPALGGGSRSPERGARSLWRWGRLHYPEWNNGASGFDGTHPPGVPLAGWVGAWQSRLNALGA